MSIQSDRSRRHGAIHCRVIESRNQAQAADGVVTPGHSPHGHDLRRQENFKRCTNRVTPLPGLRTFDKRSLVPDHAESMLTSASLLLLPRRVEYFRAPRDILTTCVAKPACARCGLGRKRKASRAGVGGACHSETSRTDPLPAKVHSKKDNRRFYFSASANLVKAPPPIARRQTRDSGESCFRYLESLPTWAVGLVKSGLCAGWREDSRG